MNPGWCKAAEAAMQELLQRIKALEQRIAELEAKRKPGRPRKEQ